MHYAGVNQTRFFAAGNDFDGKTQRRFGTGQEPKSTEAKTLAGVVVIKNTA